MLFFAQPITRAIGISGASVIQRIMGMILCAVAVNAILTGDRHLALNAGNDREPRILAQFSAIEFPHVAALGFDHARNFVK